MKRKTVIGLIIAMASIISVVVITSVVFVFNGIYQNEKLFDAIENDDYDAAQRAIANGAWINRRRHLISNAELFGFNPTPLVAACELGNQEIIELLLKNGADINKIDNTTGNTPLMAVFYGVKANRFVLAMYLIEQGADYNKGNGTSTPLLESMLISSKDDAQTIKEGFELFEYLMQHQVDINVPWGPENTLTYAAHYSNVAVVKYLIEKGYFEVDVRNPLSKTALIVAAQYGQTEIVCTLLELGADRSLTDSDGKTALDYAYEKGYDDIVSLLEE